MHDLFNTGFISTFTHLWCLFTDKNAQNLMNSFILKLWNCNQNLKYNYTHIHHLSIKVSISFQFYEKQISGKFFSVVLFVRFIFTNLCRKISIFTKMRINFISFSHTFMEIHINPFSTGSCRVSWINMPTFPILGSSTVLPVTVYSFCFTDGCSYLTVSNNQVSICEIPTTPNRVISETAAPPTCCSTLGFEGQPSRRKFDRWKVQYYCQDFVAFKNSIKRSQRQHSNLSCDSLVCLCSETKELTINHLYLYKYQVMLDTPH